MPPNPRRATEDLWRAREQKHKPRFDLPGAIDATLFDKQLAFDRDRARRKAAFCTRRAGKTDLVPKRLVKRLWSEPESIRVFLAITRIRARELIWRPLEILNEKYSLGLDMREQAAVVRFPNHSELRLRGADDKREAGKGRGDKLHGVDIDEAQTFDPEVLRTMIDDVYGPTLEDVLGDMNVYGTPGVVCAGEWYEMTRPDVEQRRKGWSVHEWGVLDNPFMAHMKARLPELKIERGWADDNPTYLREWCGRWVNDSSALFYRYDDARNGHAFPEEHFIGGRWRHVLGWDLGLRDEMALVVWAFEPKTRDVYEAFSWKKNDITSDEVVDEVRKLEKRGYNFLNKVADTGGLGALVVDEVGKRTGMHFDAAKKTEKGAHVELFNDDLLTGRAKLRRGSPYAREIAVLPKDPETPEDKWPEEDSRFANHCCDAGLYAWREALHYLHRPTEPPPPKMNDPEWHEWNSQRQQDELAELRERQMQQNRDEQRNEGEPLDFL